MTFRRCILSVVDLLIFSSSSFMQCEMFLSLSEVLAEMLRIRGGRDGTSRKTNKVVSDA